MARDFVRRSSGWVALVALPLVINVAVWVLLVAPQQQALTALRQTQTITELKPRLAALVTESQQLLTAWQRTTLPADDPSSAMQRIQRLAGQHRVRVQEINAHGQQASVEAAPPTESRKPSGGHLGGHSSTVPLALEVIGSFGNLAHWLGDVERQSGLQVETFTLAPESKEDRVQHLSVKLTALLGA